MNKTELNGIIEIQGYIEVDVMEELCNINKWIIIKPIIIKPILKWTKNRRDKAIKYEDKNKSNKDLPMIGITVTIDNITIVAQ